jgi:hypothetical protein
MAREAAEAHQADPNNSSDAPTAPNSEDNDDESNPPNQDGDFAPDSLNNLDAIIRRDMIAMYVRVLGFKESAATALYDNQQITLTAYASLTTLVQSRSSAARSAKRATLSR